MEMPLRAQEAALDIDQEYNNTLRLLNKQRCDEVEAFLQIQLERITSPEIELAMAGFFDANAKASEMCVELLRNIKSLQSNYQSTESILALNPFCTARSSLRLIHDKYSSMFRSIRSSHRKVARKLKIVKAAKKLLKIGLVAACGAAAVAAVAAASHLLFVGLMVGPAAVGLCPLALRERMTKKTQSSKTGSLLRQQEQLDTVAQGTYVLGKDLDMVSQLVARLSDGIERENAMALFCVERASKGSPVPEIMSELKRSYSNSRRLAEELEEHVCMCLDTMHRARLLVIQEISKQA